MTLTPEQLELRRTAATATDVAAIAGVDPYKTPMHVWLDKTGRLPHGADAAWLDNPRVEWGNMIEPLLRADFAKRHGVVVSEPTTMVRHCIGRSGPVRMAATPDGIIGAWGCGWEGKTHSVGVRHEYGPAGTDQVPMRELLQCQTGMLVTGLRAWRLTAFIDGLPTDYSISADDVLHQRIVELCARWWRDHVVADKPPALSAYDNDLVAALHPNESGLIRAASDEEHGLALQLQRALMDGETSKKEVERIKAEIKSAIGDDAGIQWGPGPSQRITWRKAQDSRQTDWQACAYDFAGRVQLAGSSPDIERGIEALDNECCDEEVSAIRALLGEIKKGLDIATHGKSKPGSRRFIVPRKWSES